MDTIKQKAIADGTFMKAPNGKPTNLNERQWLQVRTTNFKNWLGDWQNDPANASKVVDENGEPLVVYHGSEEHFRKFDANAKRKHDLGVYGKGFYFTSNKKLAKEYGNNKELYEVFLNIRTPYNAQEDFLGLFNNFNSEKELRDYFRSEGFSEEELDNVDFGNYDNADGVITFGEQDEIVVKNPNQIKSATDNNGDFSLANNDIEAFVDKYDLPEREFSLLYSALMTKYGNKTAYGDVICTANYEYTVNYKGAGEFDIIEYHQIDNNIKSDYYDRKNKDFSEYADERAIQDEVARRKYNSDSYNVEDGETNGDNAGLDKSTSQGESEQTEDNVSSQQHQEWRSIKRDSATGRIVFVKGDGRTISTSQDWKNDTQLFTTPQGEIYGFVDKEGNIYLDETKISPEHPIHEYTHLWDRFIQKKNPKLWQRGVELMKQTSLWDEILNDDNYDFT